MTDRNAMSASEIERILVAVPVGEDQAKGWRSVWEIADLWSGPTIKNRLAILVGDGRIRRRRDKTHTGFVWVYWRDLPQAKAREEAA